MKVWKNSRRFLLLSYFICVIKEQLLIVLCEDGVRMGKNKHKKWFVKDIIIVMVLNIFLKKWNLLLLRSTCSTIKIFSSAKAIYMYVAFQLWYTGIFIELFKHFNLPISGKTASTYMGLTFSTKFIEINKNVKIQSS